MDIIFLLIYAFVMILIVIFGVMALAYVWLKPVLPYLTAKLQKKDILLVLGKDGRLRMIPAKYSSGMYTSSDPPYSFLQRVPKAYRFGDVQSVLVHDGWGIVVDPDMLETLHELNEKGYTTYDELEEALDKGEIKKSDVVRIHAFKDIDIDILLQYVSEPQPSSIKAHLEESYASFVDEYYGLHPENKGSNMNVALILMAAGAVVAVVIGSNWMGMW